MSNNITIYPGKWESGPTIPMLGYDIRSAVVGDWCDTFLTEKVRRKAVRFVKISLVELIIRWVE